MSRLANDVRSRMRDLSIKAKLSLIALATTAAAMLVIGAVLAASEFIRYRTDTVSVMQSHAQVIAINLAAALAFKDQESALQTLSALRVAPGMHAAQIYDRDGRLFVSARFAGGGATPAPVAQALSVPRVGFTAVTIDRDIRFADSSIGFLRLEADFGGYLDTLMRFGLALLIAAACAFAASLALAMLLRDTVAGPIEALAGLVARVRRDHDFSLRAPTEGRDEVGTLAESVNTMLGEIEQRDARLARERDLVHEILNTMDAAVLVIDAESRVVEANGAFLRATGRATRACLGRPVWEAAGVDDEATFRRCLEGGEEFEARLHPAFGAPRDYAWRASRGSTVDKGSELKVVTGIDITDRKRVEDTLRQAKDAAEAANLAKSRFLANMSHEIRTPMNGVLGMAYVMQSSCTDETQRHSLQTIVDSGEALLRILNDILDFSKIEAGRLEIVNAPFPIRDHIEDVVQVFAAEGRAKGVSLHLEFEDSVPMGAVGDALRLRQVLSNLVGNAIKFTPSGSVSVRVAARPRSHPGGAGDFELGIAVTDTGIGVGLEAQTRIFDAFTQADSTTQREHGGTGLGLSISRQLTAMMGGEMSLVSELGRGSTFSFTVPVGRAPEDAFLKKGLGLRVLFADSEPALRQYEIQRMAQWGVVVDVATSVDEALDRLARAAPHAAYDAAVVDDGLAGGWARLVGEMARMQRDPPIPVALLGADTVSVAASAPQVRVAIEIPKPVKSSALYNFLLSRSNLVSGRIESGKRASFGASVLVVEDNPVNVFVARAMLESAGCRVQIAIDGLEALAALKADRFDLVLMDCQMPGLDGYAVTRIIREREAVSGGHQRIVAVTAHALSGDREACEAAGMDDYLAKPFSPSQMAAMLQANLVPGEAPRPVAKPQPQAPLQAQAQEPVHCVATFDDLLNLEREGGAGLVARLMGLFESQSMAARTTLDEAVAGLDFAAAANAMHRFRATAAHLGGLRLARLCQDIERACAAADARALAATVEGFDSEVRELASALTLAGARRGADEPQAPQPPQPPPPRGRRKALLVDDNDDERLLLGRDLRRNGYDVIEAADPATGLRLAEADQLDVVLLDRQLGHLDGIDFIAAFIRAGRNGPLPVIMVTGAVYPEIEERALSAGALGIIEKSVRGKVPERITALLSSLG